MKHSGKNENYKVIHHMADGRILDSIEGYKVPVNEKTKIAYMVLTSKTIKPANRQ